MLSNFLLQGTQTAGCLWKTGWKNRGKALENFWKNPPERSPKSNPGFPHFPTVFPKFSTLFFPEKQLLKIKNFSTAGSNRHFVEKNYTKGPHHTAFPLSPQRLSRSCTAPDFQWKRVGKNHPKMWKTKKANFRPLFFPPFPPPIIIIMVFYLFIKKKKETI